MSYIWEQPNRGSTLYEMAIIKQKALMEVTNNRSYTLTDAGKSRLDEIKNKGGDITDEGNRVSFQWDDTDPKSKEIVKTIQELLDGGLISGHGDAGSAGDGSGEAKGHPFKVIDPEANKKIVDEKLNECKANHEFKPGQDGATIVIVANAEDEKVAHVLEQLKAGTYIADAREQSEIDAESNNKRAAALAKIIEQFPESVRLQVALACHNLANGKWVDGTIPEPGSKNMQTMKTFLQAVTKGDLESAKTALLSIGDAISDGRIKVKGSADSGLYSVQNIEKQVTGNIRMPAMFDAEPDDTMWNEIVITDYGIPMVNLSHPAVKKVIASDNPEEECPGDLKLVKEKIYGNKRLQLVFGKGGFERMLGKAFNFLTLGVAAATTDAGKRADRIIKELKEKGAMSTHRNLLLAKFDDIVDADPENPDIRIPAKAYNRGTKQFVGDVEVPVAMLGRFYSAVDPIKSSKIYIEMYNNKKCGDYGMTFSESAGKADTEEKKPTEGKVEAAGVAGYPLVEYCGANRGATQQKPLYEYILCTALAVAAAAAVPQVKNLITGIRGGKRANGVNTPDAGGDPTGKQFAGLKKQFVEYLDKEGHPPSYVLKPKSANKEVVIISKASTGHTQGGKVLMVTLKVDDHQAACFMTPAECKKYFSV